MTVLPDPGRSRAVLIGASTYRHLEDLPAVRNNLSGFRDVLIAPALGGLPADNCTVVAEPARPVDVYRTLRQQAAAAEDTLLVYFAGHGRTGSRNELWLCLPGTDPDELQYSAWAYDELRRVVADSRAAKKVVILDCCFSGRALADQAGGEETILGQVGIEGSYLLTATAANAVALAPPGERYTAFTGTLLGLLNKGIPDGPELLTFAQIYPRLQYALTSRQLPRPRQQGSDTIAHLALTRNLAHTGQGGTGVFNEPLAAITAQFGHEMSASRVYAMADLTDDWPETQQTCVDALCAYLRMPYEPDPGAGAPESERLAFEASREVRHTIIRVIATHLKDDRSGSWRGLNFDFTGVVFDGGDFSYARFSGGTVSFDRARFSGGFGGFGGAEFSGGTVSFDGAEFDVPEVVFYSTVFSGARVSFDRVVFSGGTVGFAPASFSGGAVSFGGAEFSGAAVRFSADFSGAEVSFGGAEFRGGTVDFGCCDFSDGTVSFDGAEFRGGTVSFGAAEFSGGTVSFDRAGFSGAEVGFEVAKFSGGLVSFFTAKFSGSPVGFKSAEFSGSPVHFNAAEFSGGAVSFFNAKFSGGAVSFDDAGFSGGAVSFDDAGFSGGTVDFARVRRWSHPPMFSWDGKPPAGVVLPVQPIEETKSLLERG
jgi:uncharacterized protein YjbI with pentapeptide repeats